MQNLQNLRISFLAVFDVCDDVRGAVFNDGSMSRVEFVVFGLSVDEWHAKVVHLLQTPHVGAQIFKYGGPVSEDGVCCEECIVEGEPDGYGVDGVARGVQELEDGSFGIWFIFGHCDGHVFGFGEIMPGCPRGRCCK